MSFAPVPNAPAPDVCARVQALCEAAAAAAPAWTPSPEVEVFTHALNASNIAIVNTRASALTELQLTLASPTVSPLDRIQAGITIQHLPFIRLSKKARADLLIRPFITVARAFNRHLMKAKEHTGAFLTMLGRHHTFSGVERRLASAAGARTPHCKLDFGEFNDVEIPPHLLPPPPAKHREIPGDSAPATPQPAATDPAPAAPPAPSAEPPTPTNEEPATTDSPSTSSTSPAQDSTPAPLPPPPAAPAHTPSAFTTAPPGATPPSLTI